MTVTPNKIWYLLNSTKSYNLVEKTNRIEISEENKQIIYEEVLDSNGNDDKNTGYSK